MLEGTSQDINEQDGSGHSALLYAVEMGHYHAAEWLLDQGASATAATTLGNTPLHLLSNNVRGMRADAIDDVTFARLLIERGAPLGAPNTPYGHFPLDLARYAGRTALADELVASGAPAKWPL